MTNVTPRPGGSGERRPRRSWAWPKGPLAVAAASLGLLVVVAVVLVSWPRAAPPGSTGSAAAGLLVPRHGDLFGASVQPAGGSGATGSETAVAALERMLGRKLAIDQVYVPWGAPLPLALARWDLRQGTIPIISWGGASTSLIAAGAYDTQIRARALQLRGVGGPVLLRWFWEMDGTSSRADAVSAASFIRAWRHIHKIFASVGADNVRWVWCPTAAGFRTGTAQRFYPGSAYVDWIGADGYNWSPALPGAPWASFGQIFSAFYDWGKSTGKPLIVSEFGALEGTPGAKAKWITQAGRELRAEFPAIHAVVYFDSRDQQFDWRVTTSPSSLAAFRSFAREPFFSVRVPT